MPVSGDNCLLGCAAPSLAPFVACAPFSKKMGSAHFFTNTTFNGYGGTTKKLICFISLTTLIL
jgi:hypothetical protein